MRALAWLNGTIARRAALAFWFAVSGAWSATPAASPQAMLDALTRAHRAVVGIQVTAAEGARSAATLGRVRTGSGAVIAPDGLILTIGYLILEADSIQVVTHEGRTLPARAVGYDVATGFGLVKPLLPLRGIAPVPLGSHAGSSMGEAMLAIWGGEQGDVEMPTLVSKREFAGYWEYQIDTALFTSPPIGNHSGAALYNQRGELIGIGSLYVADALGEAPRTPGNMFVPVDLLKPVLGELQRTGTTRQSRRPWLGLTSSELSGHIVVVRVAADSPAQTGGIAAGDTVLAVDGVRVATLGEFYKRLWAHPNPDDEISLTILQAGAVKTVTLRGMDRMQTVAKPAGI